MIEIIYKEESKKEEPDNSFQIPVNIRQVGESKGPQKIYMEDYAYTFLRKISRGSKEGKIAILLGEHHWSQGTTYLFIKSALQLNEMEVSPEHLDLSDKVWGQVYETSSKYFPEQEILGWFLSIPGFTMQLNEMIVKTHLDYFAGNEKVLFVAEPGEWEEAFYIYENGQMNRQSGYYIYYEKNERMQNYMIEMSHNKSIEETENVPDRAVINFRQTVKQTQTEEKQEKKNWAIGAYAALAVLAVGVAVYSRSEHLQRMVLSAFADESQMQDTPVVSLPNQNQVTPTVTPGGSLGDSTFLDENGQQKEEENHVDTDQNQSNLKTDEQEKEPSLEQETNIVTAKEYIIQKGDTLTGISIAEYGTPDMIDEICRVNQIAREDLIFPGQKIVLPKA